MAERTKRVKRLLREACGEAYRRELDAALRELDTSFDAWRRGELSPFELADRIHEFHQGPNRELWSLFTGKSAEFGLVGAVRRGLIRRDELDTEIVALIDSYLETERSINARPV